VILLMFAWSAAVKNVLEVDWYFMFAVFTFPSCLCFTRPCPTDKASFFDVHHRPTSFLMVNVVT
jgi:hypothetical protein